MCGGVPGGDPGVPGWTQIRVRARGWVLAIPIPGCWVGTRYTTLPVLPSLHHPGYSPRARTSRQQGYTVVAGTLGHAHMTVLG